MVLIKERTKFPIKIGHEYVYIKYIASYGAFVNIKFTILIRFI